MLHVDKMAPLRAGCVQAAPLPEALAGVAGIESLRARTQQLLAVLGAWAEDGDPAQLLAAIWTSARAEESAGLRLLASLLEVRLSGLELLHQTLRPSQMIRLCLRHARSQGNVSESIVQAARMLGTRIGIRPEIVGRQPLETLRQFEARAVALVKQLLEGSIREVELAWLRELADTELRAQAKRLEAIAERVGAYDGRRISRVLPLLSRQEERIRDTRVILVQWPETDELRRRTPTLLEHLEPRGFEKLIEQLEASPGGREMALALRLVRLRTPLSQELAFAAAVLRDVDARVRPRGDQKIDAARCLLLALNISGTEGRLALQFGSRELRQCHTLVERLRLPLEGDVLRVAYDPRRHPRFLAKDGVPALIGEGEGGIEDLRAAVIANVENEHILCGLLANARVAALAGLVERVVRRTRSVKVLLEIANRRDLHTGYANRNVPNALLWHPTAIPVSALRKFVHVRFVDRAELVALSGRGSRARPEIRQLASSYLATLSNR
ncbi:MAG: hypothetical protein ACE5G2_07345 [Candidatus Krumholzibacteriia bacterium]